MYIGGIVGLAACLSYPLLGNMAPTMAITMFFLLRFIHGFCAGFLPTGATALVTDILPAKSRSVGMGIWGTFMSVGFGSGQMMASWITNNWGINVLFFVAAGFALCALITISLLKETLPKPQRFERNYLKVTMRDVFEAPVMPAATVMFLSVISTGIVFVISQEISTFLGLNKGWFFGFYVISTIFVRLVASRLSDVIGRRKTLIIGMSFLSMSIFMVSICMMFKEDSTKIMVYSIGATIFGISTGISSPTVFAWMADLSHEARRGVGAGTLFIALEAGIMLGSLSTMITYNNTPESIFVTFLLGIIAALTGVAYLIWHLKYRHSDT